MQDNILLTGQVREMIDRKPHWSIRNGNVVFLVFLLGILATSWFIRIPSVVRGSVQISRDHDGYRLLMTTYHAGVMSLIPGEQVVIQPEGYPDASARIAGTVLFVSRSVTSGDSSLVDVRLGTPPPLLSNVRAIMTWKDRRLLNLFFGQFDRFRNRHRNTQ